MNQTKSTNPERIKLIRLLKKQSRENKTSIWLNIAKYLTKSQPQRTAVNLSKINRYTEKNEVVIVPGKVLGTGKLDHPVELAAFSLSRKAKEKIKAAESKYLTIQELMEKNPKGKRIKLIK
ncbi:MAG: 50S ribosomal protein L18e [miscellaneous Crenarchaeota group-6 archaeon AD8-1]|nr:MAG: 50S ribosomal protein L18e [miscellaneous Crenarchaeota group-6 archaeon AD8-1]